MRLPLFQLDAFASRVFAGNPAAIVPLESPLEPATMQSIAMENNLSETAFIRREAGRWSIRWFTPAVEIDLCGHATLAAAWVVFHRLDPAARSVTFSSKSGDLTVARDGDTLVLDFPSRPPAPAAAPPELALGLRRAPRETFLSRDWMALYASESEVRALAPDFRRLAELSVTGIIATAPGDSCDFVSRFFAPASGVDEDPVTGSAHCSLIPFWAARLGRTKLRARQISARGGELECELKGDRVGIGGRVVPYLEGSIEV